MPVLSGWFSIVQITKFYFMMLVCSALQSVIDNCNVCNTTRKQRRKRRVTVFTHLVIRWTSGLLSMQVQFLYIFLSFLCSFRPKIRKHGNFAISVFLVLFWLLIFGLLTFPEYLASLFVSLTLLCLFSVHFVYVRKTLEYSYSVGGWLYINFTLFRCWCFSKDIEIVQSTLLLARNFKYLLLIFNSTVYCIVVSLRFMTSKNTSNDSLKSCMNKNEKKVFKKNKRKKKV